MGLKICETLKGHALIKFVIDLLIGTNNAYMIAVFDICTLGPY